MSKLFFFFFKFYITFYDLVQKTFRSLKWQYQYNGEGDGADAGVGGVVYNKLQIVCKWDLKNRHVRNSKHNVCVYI